MKLIVDLEANGFLENLNCIHCIVVKDIETNKVYRYNPDNLEEGLKLLKQAELLIGHNIQGYDIPALNKVFGFKCDSKLFDTLLCSRLIWTNRQEADYKYKDLPPKLYGRHSLAAWGYRLGLRKGAYAEEQGDKAFVTYSKDLEDYCANDVEVTHKLYEAILKQNYSKDAIDLEHRFAHWIRKQERYGIKFDKSSAENLYQILTKRKLDLEEKLSLVFREWRKFTGTFIPKRDNKSKGYRKGIPVQKYKTEIFNPNSREHIANRLMAIKGWKPKAFTETGKPEVNEAVLKSLPYPEAKILAEYLLIQKRISQLATGEQAYLKLIKGDRIYGKLITNGAVTGRCTHFHPNLGQVVSKTSPYGTQMRKLFIADADMDFVGVDFQSLELRVLAHYMSVYDNGHFKKTLLTSDIHAANQQAIGLPTRALAKTYVYAALYGSGDKKLSDICGVSLSEGKRLRENFYTNLPALKTLTDAVKRKYRTQGWVKGLDGRKVICRSEHSSLNTLIQGAGSLIVKMGTIILNEDLHAIGLQWGRDYAQVLHVHDEMQYVVKKDKVKIFKKTVEEIFNKVQNHFNFRCPLSGEVKVGQNWSDTH